MGLIDKIEEIRDKPEHIRRRYVWFWVVVTMLLVIGIWVFSLKNSFQRSESSLDLETTEIFRSYK